MFSFFKKLSAKDAKQRAVAVNKLEKVRRFKSAMERIDRASSIGYLEAHIYLGCHNGELEMESKYVIGELDKLGYKCDVKDSGVPASKHVIVSWHNV